MSAEPYRLDTPRVVGVGSGKGGVGKSTTSVHLATFADLAGYRTLLVDTDVNRTAYEWVMRAGDRMPFAIDAQTDGAVLARLHEISGYDIIIVDLPGARTTAAWTALLHGGEEARTRNDVLGLDALIVPTQVETADLRVTTAFIAETIAPLGLPYLLVGTRVRHQSVTVALRALNNLVAGGFNVARTIIRDLSPHGDAITQNRPITQVGPRHSTARHSTARMAEREYRDLAREIFAGLLTLTWPTDTPQED
ncbi:MAG: ParA family protein [Pseudonocardia sp.]|nr:ParA family protein [Pseudonocardia sp.]